MPHDTQVLVVAAIGIAIVVVLIVRVKFHAFLALTIGALFVGIASGIPLDKVTASFETGVGGVLGYVGILIGLGAMLGKLLADSAIPCVIVAGPLFGRLAAYWVPIGAAGAGLAVTGASSDVSSSSASAGSAGSSTSTSTRTKTATGTAQDPDATGRPSFAITLVTLLSPIVLMLSKAAGDIWFPSGNSVRTVLDFIGDPVFALLFAVLLAMVTFGLRVGFDLGVLSKKIGASLLPIVGVLFIVGDRRHRHSCGHCGAAVDAALTRAPGAPGARPQDGTGSSAELSYADGCATHATIARAVRELGPMETRDLR